MFGIRLTTRREILLWLATIDDLKKENQRLRVRVKEERERADAAVNALLRKAAGVTLPQRPEEARKTAREIEEIQNAVMGIFGSEETSDALPPEQDFESQEARTMRKIQEGA